MIMARSRWTVAVTATIIILLAGSVPRAENEFVWGTSSASPSTDLLFEGYWKYCLEIGGDISAYDPQGHGLSHVSILLSLEDCPCSWSWAHLAFADTAGSGSGDSGCVVLYYVEFDCKGDPTVPDDAPAIKFEPYEGSCEPAMIGSARVSFYSLARPIPIDTARNELWIKFGSYIERGRIEGYLPRCELGPSYMEATRLGRIKALFR